MRRVLSLTILYPLFSILSLPNPAHAQFKYEGAPTCSAVKCHGQPQPNPAPKIPADEFTHWSAKDRHNTGFETLKKPASAEIAKKLNIASATSSEKCLTCHAVNAPAAMQGEEFTLNEGVTCDACHGASEKWREPHATEGWTQKQRTSMSHADLLKTLGLYDTKPLIARAQKCTSCHLAIDASMVAAGHPQPQFEMVYFSNPQVYEDRHWRQPEGYADVKLWAAGQLVCVHDAALQLAERASGNASDDLIKSAYEQAMAHCAPLVIAININRNLSGMESLDGAAANLRKAMSSNDKSALSAASKQLADTASQYYETPGKVLENKSWTTNALSSIANDSSIAKDFGQHGITQQAYAIFALYNAYATAEKPANKDEILGLIGTKLFPEEKKQFTPDEFIKNLAEVKAKLPTQ